MWDKLYNKYPDNNFLKIMANKRIRSAVYLLLWFIAIGIVYIVYLKPIEDYNKNHPKNSINEVSNITNEENNNITFEDMKNTLLNSNFAYVYKYNNEVVYKGEILGTKSTGYRETNDGIIKYYLEDGKEYEVSFGVLKETEYDLLFDTYFSVDYIFNLIKNYDSNEVENGMAFQNGSIYIKILDDNYNIKSIEILIDDDRYYLEFSKIGEINIINY